MGRTSNTTDRREQIVGALIAVMAKQGYDGASVGDVARKAGLAPGLVHYHFKNKLEILVEAVRTIAKVHEQALDQAIDALAVDPHRKTARDVLDPHAKTARDAHRETLDPGDPARELVAFIDVHLGLGAHAAPDLLACWVLVVAEALREKRVRAEVAAVLAALAKRAEDILERGNATKVFSCNAPEAAAALIATIQGYFAVAATARDVIPSGSAARCTLRMMEGLVGATLVRRAAPKRTRDRAGAAR